MKALAILLLSASLALGQTNIFQNANIQNGFIGGGTFTNTPTPPAGPDTNLVPSGSGIWLRAANLTNANGTAVSFWPDMSTNASHATQSTVANQPVLDSGWLRFYSTSNHWVSAPHNANLTNGIVGEGVTALIVFKTNTIPIVNGIVETLVSKGTNWTGQCNHYVFHLQPTNFAVIASDNIGNIGGAGDNRNLSGTNFWIGDIGRIAEYPLYSVSAYATNGTTNVLTWGGSVNPLTENVSPLYIGSQLGWIYGGATASAFNGWIREIIIWPRKLTWTERSNALYYATSY